MTTEIMTDRDRGQARRIVEGLTRKMLSAAASRRQGEGIGNGARAPAALGQPHRGLEVLADKGSRLAQGERGDHEVTQHSAPVTPLNYKTAVRALPPVLAKLAADDPRRRAALAYSDSLERIGAVQGVSLEGGDTKSGVSDGGATTRVKHAARLRRIEALANGWEVGRTGCIARGAPRLALEVQRQRGKARNIRVMELLTLVCLDGHDLRHVLERHGWRVHSKHTKALGAALLEVLDDIADGLGFGRFDA